MNWEPTKSILLKLEQNIVLFSTNPSLCTNLANVKRRQKNVLNLFVKMLECRTWKCSPDTLKCIFGVLNEKALLSHATRFLLLLGGSISQLTTFLKQ